MAEKETPKTDAAAQATAAAPTVVTSGNTMVVVHPLVLLSAVDHYHRLLKDADPNKRVVGVLLGSISKGVVDITNSYAVPFEEDTTNPKVWFLDHNYHETMWAMFRKVNARERVVGWYSTGPKIKPNDLDINEIFRRYTSDPVLVIIDVHLHEVGIPTKAYVSVEEVLEDGTNSRRFHHLPSSIEALEAEEVGVEHLLRDVKDTNISTLATQINDKVLALKSLITRLEDIHRYLKLVLSNKLPPNHTIINHIQEIFNLLPNLKQESLVQAFNIQTNDQSVVIYVSALIRTVIALHNLIINKLDYKAAEEKELDDEKKAEEKAKEDELKKKAAAAVPKEGAAPATPKQQ